MNYSNPELIEILAQRYVVGTMSFRARRRFAQILSQNPAAMDRVLAWEERLAPLVLALDPVKPSDLVWQRIAREIAPSAPARAERWKLANVAVVAFLAVSVGITGLGWWQATKQVPETVIVTRPEAAAISVLADADNRYWLARIYQQSARLDIEVQNVIDVPTGKDYELWTIQDDGTPVSLGLLPRVGRISVELSAPVLAAIARSNLLAVSLEPAGGSPQPQPTGPVLYSGPLIMPQT